MKNNNEKLLKAVENAEAMVATAIAFLTETAAKYEAQNSSDDSVLLDRIQRAQRLRDERAYADMVEASRSKSCQDAIAKAALADMRKANSLTARIARWFGK